MRKRVISLLLVAVALVSLTACGKKKDEGVDNSAIERFQTAMGQQPKYTKVDMDFDGELTMSMGAQSMNLSMDSQTLVDMKDLKKPEALFNATMKVNNNETQESQSLEVYVKDKWAYFSDGRVKQKSEIPASAFDNSETLIEDKEDKEDKEVKLDATEFSKFVLKDAEGDDVGYDIEFNLEKEDGIAKTLEKQAQALMTLYAPAGSKIEVKGIRASVITDKDNAIKEARVELDTRVELNGQSVDAALKINGKLNKTNDEVTITPPKNLKEYKTTAPIGKLPSVA